METTRWFLKSPVDSSGREVDPRLFTQGVRVASPAPLRLPLRRNGEEVSFNFCDFDMVVTPSALNAELQTLVGSAIQRIPVTIETKAGKYEILNVCELVDCVDESRSTFTKWTDAAGRPEKVGQFRMFSNFKIKPLIAHGHHIFRIAGWPIALIASEQVKSLFETKSTSGVAYEPVD
jgi:hypothetical protein